MPRFHSAPALVFSLLLWFSPQLLAEWTDGPSVNTPVAEAEGSLLQPQMVMRDDGGSYVSWLQNSGGGFDVRLQRLDADGVRQWDEAGVLVAERDFTSTEAYGLDIDTDGHAVLAFRDDRSGSLQITASRVAPDGSLAWGSAGVQLTEDDGFYAAPRITAAGDGSIVAGWFADGDAALVGLEPDGQERWNTTISGDNGLAVSDLRASDQPGESGEVIVLLATLDGFTVPRHLFAQKFDAQGNALWGEQAVTIFDAGSLQLGNFPGFRADGAGGMAVSWYQSQPALQVYLQHLDADGEATLPAGGLPVSTDTSRLRSVPALAVDPAGPEYFVFWRETDSLQNDVGLWGQRIDTDGQRLWGGAGAEFIELGSQGDLTDIDTTRVAGQPLVSVVRSGDELVAAAVDNDAQAGSFEAVSNAPGGRSRASVRAFGSGAYFVWEDQRGADSDIFAHRLLFEAEDPVFADRFEAAPEAD